MYRDTSFINLTRPEILWAIDIDQRLVRPFTRVMYRMQEYFNRHNYTRNFDYARLFRDFILTANPKNKLHFLVSSKDEKLNCSGYYNGYKNVIVINENSLYSNDIEKTLCHEFIHFLTMHHLIKRNVTEPKSLEIRNGGFINEAYTEMLTLEIYNEGKCYSGYEAQVKMLEFANELCGSINHYQSFLLGYVDIDVLKDKKKNRRAMAYERDFYKFVSLYQKTENEYSYEAAANSEYYLKAQRSLILGVLETVANIDDYLEVLKKMPNMPIPDYGFLNNALAQKEKKLIDSLRIKDQRFKDELLDNFNNYKIKLLEFNQKFVELPFDNGFVRFFGDDDYIIYVNSRPCYNKKLLRRITKIFTNGIYKYYYNVDNKSYIYKHDKVEIYRDLQFFEDKFFRQLSAVKKNGTIDESYYYRIDDWRKVVSDGLRQNNKKNRLTLFDDGTFYDEKYAVASRIKNDEERKRKR